MKTIKIFSLIMIVIALILTLSACDSTSKIEKAEDTEEKMLRPIEYYPYYGQVVVDIKTGVLYWMSLGPQNHGTLTVLVNEDGTPRVLKGE